MGKFDHLSEVFLQEARKSATTKVKDDKYATLKIKNLYS